MKTSSSKPPGLRRWVRFNAVGTLGFGVQICTASILIAATSEPLLATALAVETAVLHNFSWHYFLTWKDHRQGKCVDFLRRLLVFNATNGIVSLTGNLLFAWLIVERQHTSVILANLLAIAVCSLINFILCEKLVFRIATNRGHSSRISTSVHRVVRVIALVTFCFVVGTVTTRAQDAASPKFTLFAGPGIIRTQGISRGEVQAGVSLDEAPPDAGGGFSFEAGYLGPWSKPHIGSAFLSVDYMAAWNLGPSGSGRTAKGTHYWSDHGWKLLPFASAGYTRLFGTGNAVNFGGGVDYRLSNNRAIRIEVRDYYSPSAAQHNVALRIGLVIYISD